jgi:glycosyltransferase involved in cell wall biosynthesis
MYILSQYPQLSETYIKTEMEALCNDFDIKVIALGKADFAYKRCFPFLYLTDPALICEAVEDYRPHVIHTHWLREHIGLVADVAKRANVPFTVRAHSFDTLWKEPSLLRRLTGSRGVPSELSRIASLINDDLCLGVLVFPFTLARLRKAGISEAKLHACFPVVHYPRFLDRSSNGDAVMNTGACLAKKQFEDFLELGRSLPDREFNLYAIGYDRDRIQALNDAKGKPVNMISPVEPDDMPAQYKKHRWLVYTASREIATVGWSVSIAEAQASGVGVCVPNLRPDLREYVGEGGFLYNSMSEVKDIISKPFPEEMRQAGFEQAKKSDIFRHRHALTDLWAAAISA